MTPDDLLNNVSRRTFLKISAIWTGGAWIVGIPGLSSQSYDVLTREEADIMDLLADCMVPPDDFAGGKEAGVTNFIDQQISRNGYLTEDRDLYKTCLPALNRTPLKEYKKHFLTLDRDARIEYLKKLERGFYDHSTAEEIWEPFIPSHFFAKMRDQCLMGFYGSPKHGGNNNYVSYRMIRF
ncbi:gluconate 2-dehydrogenase subunit 3 family protein [Rhodohalobacter sulfatireducens]|uniref:Gluconate 2-dehydrogenase subunit 3 family protein n=1 Tax=Rhodohalobacter sulfatireducens TaxID=2911366 RepID=A0ABS9KGA6_9BACT|nr:gluconate 2-dehydrogenase subunit 3 family protein [Rhodohalobacter sulfatireducens]MCG2589885.1 gluconate 2-dehydrogenase subunit 3 family protein [Rhodohalobacter sulfatireducens]